MKEELNVDMTFELDFESFKGLKFDILQ